MGGEVNVAAGVNVGVGVGAHFVSFIPPDPAGVMKHDGVLVGLRVVGAGGAGAMCARRWGALVR